MLLEDIPLLIASLNPRRYTATKCGHRTKRTGRVSAFECSIITRMPKNESGSVDHCLSCLGKMTIQCAWCKNPIFIGHPVTLYTPGNKDFKLPAHAVVHKENPLQLVGCLGWMCAETGADRAGFWMPGEDGKGRVDRVPTAYEVILGTSTPSVVIVDVADPQEAKNPRLIPLEDAKR